MQNHLMPPLLLFYDFIDFPAVAGIVEGYLVEIQACTYGEITDDLFPGVFLPIIGNGFDLINLILPDKPAGIDLSAVKKGQNLDSFI